MHTALHIAKCLLCDLKEHGWLTEVKDLVTHPVVSQRPPITDPGVSNVGLCFQPFYNCIRSEATMHFIIHLKGENVLTYAEI